MKRFLTLLCGLMLATSAAIASDAHDHKKEENPHADEGHEDSHDHQDHGDHAEEENSQTGPEKGILAASADRGIQLSPEAEKQFEVKKLKVDASTIELPRSAIVTSGVEVNLFRYRDGFYKRIDFKLVKKNATTIIAQSKDLKAGDEVALTGLGFLRTAEVAAFGGAPEGHSH